MAGFFGERGQRGLGLLFLGDGFPVVGGDARQFIYRRESISTHAAGMDRFRADINLHSAIYCQPASGPAL